MYFSALELTAVATLAGFSVAAVVLFFDNCGNLNAITETPYYLLAPAGGIQHGLTGQPEKIGLQSNLQKTRIADDGGQTDLHPLLLVAIEITLARDDFRRIARVFLQGHFLNMTQTQYLRHHQRTGAGQGC